jgi:hypothetical protein
MMMLYPKWAMCCFTERMCWKKAIIEKKIKSETVQMKIIKITGRYAMGTVFGLWLLATSCDGNQEVPGKMTTVYVQAPSIREGASEELLRTASPTTYPMETMALDGGLLLDVCWEPDESSALRASSAVLESDKRFRVIALKAADGTYVSHGDFEVGGATSVSSLHVLENVNHDFICISYNTAAALPAAQFTVGQVASLEINSAGAGDLLYGKVNKTITASDRELSFSLTHCLSRVRLTVDHTYNEWDASSVSIGNIYLYPFYMGAVVKLQDWSLITEGGAPVPRYFSNWTAGSNPRTQSCDFTTVFTKGETVMMVIPKGAITVLGETHPSVETRVPFSIFSPGNNYTLRLTMRIPRWAGSNIYWDTIPQRLTFALEGDTQNQGFQGVFFRWGSLVGISPAQVGVSNNFTTSVPVYVPSYNAGDPHQSTWTALSPSPYTTWTSFAAGTAANDTTEIPYMDGRAEFINTLSSRTSTYVIDAARNTDLVYAGLRGDICQYLGKTVTALDGYRLPTSMEYGTINSGQWNALENGWEKGNDYSTSNALGNSHGTALLLTSTKPGYAKNTKAGNAIFPASGNRGTWNGALASVGSSGRYHTGSAAAYETAHILSFDATSITFNASTGRGIATTVRCIKK